MFLMSTGQSIHGQAVAAGVMDAATCTDCHGEHRILAPGNPESPVYLANVSQVTCSRCHANTQLMARFNVPASRVPTYEDSYHGLASSSGQQTVANCASCHGVHNIFASSDPRSTVNKANLGKTCGKCHPDAGQRFTIGSVHTLPTSTAGGRVLDFVKAFYLLAIPVILGFHAAAQFFGLVAQGTAHPGAIPRGPRAGAPDAERARATCAVAGQFHHPGGYWLCAEISALVLGGAHCAVGEEFPLARLAASPGGGGADGRFGLPRDLPVSQRAGPPLDEGHASQSSRRAGGRANGGLQPGVSTPTAAYARFNYAEKAEYWALVYGTLVMALTGILLWAHDSVLAYLPHALAVLEVTTAIHFYEAILATFSILIWHFYFVILIPTFTPSSGPC